LIGQGVAELKYKETVFQFGKYRIPAYRIKWRVYIAQIVADGIHEIEIGGAAAPLAKSIYGGLDWKL
jgi:hypothetical protein